MSEQPASRAGTVRALHLCRALDRAGSRAGVRRTQKGGDGLVQRITVVPNRPTAHRADTPQQPHKCPRAWGVHKAPTHQQRAVRWAPRHPQTNRGQSGRHSDTHKPAEVSQVGTQTPISQHRAAQAPTNQQRAARHPQTSRGQSGGHPGTHEPARAARPATRLRLLCN